MSPDPIGLAGGANLYGYVGGGGAISATDPTGEVALSLGGALIGAALDIGVQLAVNGMRPDCIKLESVALAAAAGALNPFALGGALVKAEKANRQLQRAYSLREGSRAAKRTALRSDKSRASAWKELTSWAAIEGGTEGLSNLIPDDLHIRVGDQSTQCGCNGQ